MRHVMIEALEGRTLLAVSPGTGLEAVYFDNGNFTGTSTSRVDRKVYFDFARTPPPAPIGNSIYSVRWTGRIKPSFSETYAFYSISDDGVRVWVNHKLLIDDWKSHPAREDAGTIALVGSRKYDIQVEYFNNAGAAAVQLWWSSTSQIKSVVPTARLYPEAQNLASKIDHVFSFAEQQLAATVAELGGDANKFPINTIGSGSAGSEGTRTATGRAG